MPAPLVADLLALAALALAEPVPLLDEPADADTEVETAEPATRREVLAAEAAEAAEVAATVELDARAALTDEDHWPVIWVSLHDRT